MTGFWRIHEGLDREGPGSAASTRQALAMVTDLPRVPLVLDVGCGPGASAVELAVALPAARVVAVDLHEPFVAATRARATAAGVTERLTAVVGDMADLPAALAAAGEPGPVDLLWCEGAAYLLGFEAALRAWRPLLAPDGALALTEPLWISPTVPVAVSRFWEAAYPYVQVAQSRRAQIAAAGYRRVGDFTLPVADWEAYYVPLRDRVAALRGEAEEDADLAAAIAATEEELAIFDGGGATTVGYQFFVMRRRD